MGVSLKLRNIDRVKVRSHWLRCGAIQRRAARTLTQRCCLPDSGIYSVYTLSVAVTSKLLFHRRFTQRSRTQSRTATNDYHNNDNDDDDDDDIDGNWSRTCGVVA